MLGGILVDDAVLPIGNYLHLTMGLSLITVEEPHSDQDLVNGLRGFEASALNPMLPCKVLFLEEL
jgi:hypothetical protein